MDNLFSVSQSLRGALRIQQGLAEVLRWRLSIKPSSRVAMPVAGAAELQDMNPGVIDHYRTHVIHYQGLVDAARPSSQRMQDATTNLQKAEAELESAKQKRPRMCGPPTRVVAVKLVRLIVIPLVLPLRSPDRQWVCCSPSRVSSS